mmetsp:Transcript_19775/g.50211  ORF Transcript_19775/g.50211 Transcript_19775/m.50211 type:complete len:216 (-) Transcript_19775:5468-6115(-)
MTQIAPDEVECAAEQHITELKHSRHHSLHHRRLPRRPRFGLRICAHARERLHVDDAHAGDSGGRGDSQILHLKDDVHARRHSDDLAGHETQLLVVVQNRVHGFDPQRVHRPIKDEPLPVLPPQLRELLDAVAVEGAKDAVRPLVRVLVELAVELAHGDRLGVALRNPDPVELLEVVELGHRQREHLFVRGFAAASRPDKHQPVAQNCHLVKLNAL